MDVIQILMYVTLHTLFSLTSIAVRRKIAKTVLVFTIRKSFSLDIVELQDLERIVEQTPTEELQKVLQNSLWTQKISKN